MWLRPWTLATVLVLVSWHGSQPLEAQPYRPSQAPQAGQPAAGQAAADQAPATPVRYQLTVEEQNKLDLVLRAWQQKSSEIKRFSSKFARTDYNVVFAPPGADPNKPSYICGGVIKFAQPDKGLFLINEEQNMKTGKWTEIENGDHWVCDGKAIYQFDHVKKELAEHRLPPQLQGKAISDGPLPFVFGVEAVKMKQRYWLKVITPKEVQGQIWLEASPKLQQDAANFMTAQIILTNDTLLPVALQIYDINGKDRKVYFFNDPKVNGPLDIIKDFFTNFAAPQTPYGWKRMIHEAPLPVAGPQMPPLPGNQGQAQRPLLPAQR